MIGSIRSPSARGSSVEQDWRAWLPEEQDVVFRKILQKLESNYTMLSISLNEAIELRQEKNLGESLRAVQVSASLCLLLTDLLGGLLRAIYQHAQHYGTIPNAAPLDPANFQGQKSQKSARRGSLLNHLLLSPRRQSLHKLSTLGEMVEDLGKDYRGSAAELSAGTSRDPRTTWEALDADHYDLNTCVRESIVLLKSFLLVLPADQLSAFQKTILEQSKIPATEAPARQRMIGHRRMAPIAGQ